MLRYYVNKLLSEMYTNKIINVEDCFLTVSRKINVK